MAKLIDLPIVLRKLGPYRFCKRVIDETLRDDLFTWAAALAYSWLFAVFPFFIFLLALVPYLPFHVKSRAMDEVHGLLKILPRESSEMLWKNIQGNVSNLLYQPRGTLVYAGLGVTLWAASSGMSMTMSALDRCYELETRRPFHVQRSLALLLTIIVIVLLLAVVCLLPVASALKGWLLNVDGVPRHTLVIIAFDVARWSLSLVFMILVLSVVYYKGPAIRHQFQLITPGALFSVVVWVLLAALFRTYVDRMGSRGYQKTYGAVGGVAILLLFFYIDALVLLIGAEINSEIDFEILGVRRGARDFRKPADYSLEPTGV